MKKILSILLLVSLVSDLAALGGTITLTNGHGSVFTFNAADVPLSRIPALDPNVAAGNLSSATNIIHSTDVVVSNNYTISQAEAIASASAFYTYWIDTTASNIVLTFPTNFTFKFTVLNVGTNHVTNSAPAGHAFVILPMSGGISYQSTLVNKDVGKAQTFRQRGTNFYVTEDFRPLPNFISNVTNNLPLITQLSAGDGSGLSNVTATISVTTTNVFTATNDAVWFLRQDQRAALTNGYLRNISVADTNGYIRAIAVTDTNYFTPTNDAVWFLRQDQRVALTNGYLRAISAADTNGYIRAIAVTDTNVFTPTNDVVWFIRQDQRVALTNGYLRAISVADTNGYIRNISVADTNGYIRSISPGDTNAFLRTTITGNNSFIAGNNAGGVEVAITNADNSAWSGFTAQADNGSFVTNYVGLYINNSAFVPGSTYAGTTNDAILEMAAGNFIVDMIGGNAHWYFITRAATNGVMTTNWDLTASALNFKTHPQFNGANLLTTIAVGVTNQFTPTNDTTWFIPQSTRVALTNGYIRAIAVTDTNVFTATNDAVWFLRQDQRDVLTNGYLRTIAASTTNYFTPTNDTTWFIAQSSKVALTNGYIAHVDWTNDFVGQTNAIKIMVGVEIQKSNYLITLAAGSTNQFLPTNSAASVNLGGLIRATNGFYSVVSNLFPVQSFSIGASATTFFTNIYNRDIVVGYTATTLTGVGMTGTNAGVGGAFVQWQVPLTGGLVPLRANHTASFTNGASAATATWTPFP